MKYDFTSVIDRRGLDALAVDAVGRPGGSLPAPRAGFDPIPMWVADMNFPTAPSVSQAMADRAGHPLYGYFYPREEYFQAIVGWQRDRNGVAGLSKEHIGYENGVLGGVVSALNVFCSRGDSVLLHSPTYVGFTGSLTENGYHIVHSPLAQDEAGVYRMDFDNMERKIVDNKIHAAVLCSPHNPCGRVWERWELEQAMDLFRKHDVMVVSDEIWSDIILGGHRHIPTQSVSQDARNRTVAMYAPSKTFNLAGLVGSYHIIYNKMIRERVEKESALCRYNEMNLMSMYALLGAYSPQGREWVDELRQVLTENVDFACGYIARRFEGVRVSRPQGTYMLFLDCAQWCGRREKTLDQLLRAGWDVGVYWQDGRPFHGPCHIRMNLALPRSRVEEAFRRLDQYVLNG